MSVSKFLIPFLLISAGAWSAPVQWEAATGGNDHYYEYIPSSRTWDDARAEALAQGGYLATITSLAEQEFLYALYPEISWIGGSDSLTEGVWQWMDGPEAGLVFWDNGPTAAFSFWHAATDEPNDWADGEDYLQFAFAQEPWEPIGAWNDDGGPGFHAGLAQGYIVEFGDTAAVPLPGAAWLMGTAMLGALRWGRRVPPVVVKGVPAAD